MTKVSSRAASEFRSMQMRRSLKLVAIGIIASATTSLFTPAHGENASYAKRAGDLVVVGRVTTDTGPAPRLRVGRQYTYNVQLASRHGTVPRVALVFTGLQTWSRLGDRQGRLGWNYCNAYSARWIGLARGGRGLDLGPSCSVESVAFRPIRAGMQRFRVRIFVVHGLSKGIAQVNREPDAVLNWQGTVAVAGGKS